MHVCFYFCGHSIRATRLERVRSGNYTPASVCTVKAWPSSILPDWWCSLHWATSCSFFCLWSLNVKLWLRYGLCVQSVVGTIASHFPTSAVLAKPPSLHPWILVSARHRSGCPVDCPRRPFLQPSHKQLHSTTFWRCSRSSPVFRFSFFNPTTIFQLAYLRSTVSYQGSPQASFPSAIPQPVSSLKEALFFVRHHPSYPLTFRNHETSTTLD